ncbi:MAG: hypothetical protein SGILL_008992 [Bacillariaceae sp.]
MARSEEAILRRALKRQRTEEEQRKADRRDMEQSKLRKALQEEQERREKNHKNDPFGSKKEMKGTPFLATAERKEATERKAAVTPVSPSKAKPAMASMPSIPDAKTTPSSTPSKDTDRRPIPPSHTLNEPDDRMKEDGAWKCPSCDNENFASRNWCNSKTCNERRPGNVNAPPSFRKPRTPSENFRQRSLMTEPGAWDCPSCGFQNYASRDICFNRSCRASGPGSSGMNKSSSSSSSNNNNNKRNRHDPETSKTLVWSKQADSTTLTKNQELRGRYHTTGGEGMTEEEIERAKILIARDARKKQKRSKGNVSAAPGSGSFVAGEPEKEKETASEQSEEAAPHSSQPASARDKPKKCTDAKRIAKSQKDKNKALMERFRETKGKGMKEEEVERAKTLIARKERKEQNRTKAAEQAKMQAEDSQIAPQ